MHVVHIRPVLETVVCEIKLAVTFSHSDHTCSIPPPPTHTLGVLWHCPLCWHFFKLACGRGAFTAEFSYVIPYIVANVYAHMNYILKLFIFFFYMKVT